MTFKDGITTLGTGPVNTTTNKATFTTSALAVGSHSITADYGGSVDDAASNSAALAQTVNKGATTTSTLVSISQPGHSRDRDYLHGNCYCGTRQNDPAGGPWSGAKATPLARGSSIPQLIKRCSQRRLWPLERIRLPLSMAVTLTWTQARRRLLAKWRNRRHYLQLTHKEGAWSETAQPLLFCLGSNRIAAIRQDGRWFRCWTCVAERTFSQYLKTQSQFEPSRNRFACLAAPNNQQKNTQYESHVFLLRIQPSPRGIRPRRARRKASDGEDGRVKQNH